VEGMEDLVGQNILWPSSSQGDHGDGSAEVEIAVRRELLGAAEPGWQLSCRVKLTPNGPMAEPHPAVGDLSVTPA
jgi:hypothetical protein